MPILLWGDTSIAWTFTEGFQRIHAYQSDPNQDAREEVQEYVENYTGHESLIIINTDLSDGPILDWTNIDSRHIMMDIGCKDVTSSFLKGFDVFKISFHSIHSRKNSILFLINFQKSALASFIFNSKNFFSTSE